MAPSPGLRSVAPTLAHWLPSRRRGGRLRPPAPPRPCRARTLSFPSLQIWEPPRCQWGSRGAQSDGFPDCRAPVSRPWGPRAAAASSACVVSAAGPWWQRAACVLGAGGGPRSSALSNSLGASALEHVELQGEVLHPAVAGGDPRGDRAEGVQHERGHPEEERGPAGAGGARAGGEPAFSVRRWARTAPPRPAPSGLGSGQDGSDLRPAPRPAAAKPAPVALPAGPRALASAARSAAPDWRFYVWHVFLTGDKLILKTQEYNGHAIEYIGYVTEVRAAPLGECGEGAASQRQRPPWALGSGCSRPRRRYLGKSEGEANVSVNALCQGDFIPKGTLWSPATGSVCAPVRGLWPRRLPSALGPGGCCGWCVLEAAWRRPPFCRPREGALLWLRSTMVGPWPAGVCGPG